MKIKVCGMKFPDNINELKKLPIDYMGLILYPKSVRYFFGEDKELSVEAKKEALFEIPPHIKKVGVFVNDDPMHISFCIKHMKLDAIQLHGSESELDCDLMRDLHPNTELIKAFNVSVASDFDQAKDYEGLVDFFLFDTKTPQHGGSGQKFDWSILDAYKGNTPFFLSGGISSDDVEAIKRIKHPLFYGIDLNSKFETAPGLKNIQLLQQFIKALKDEQN